jgi:hypothetical protein
MNKEQKKIEFLLVVGATLLTIFLNVIYCFIYPLYEHRKLPENSDFIANLGISFLGLSVDLIPNIIASLVSVIFIYLILTRQEIIFEVLGKGLRLSYRQKFGYILNKRLSKMPEYLIEAIYEVEKLIISDHEVSKIESDDEYYKQLEAARESYSASIHVLYATRRATSLYYLQGYGRRWIEQEGNLSQNTTLGKKEIKRIIIYPINIFLEPEFKSSLLEIISQLSRISHPLILSEQQIVSHGYQVLLADFGIFCDNHEPCIGYFAYDPLLEYNPKQDDRPFTKAPRLHISTRNEIYLKKFQECFISCWQNKDLQGLSENNLRSLHNNHRSP